MEAATMERVQAEEGLVEKEAAVTVIAELLKAMEGNESQQGGEETERIVYFEGNGKGDIESNDSITEEKPGNEKSDSNITKADSQKSVGTVYDRKRDGNPKNDSLNYLHPLPSEKSQSSGSLSLKDRRLEVIELDVERVIEEQDTHDLYCPNCNSCITKRVILRKRKRQIPSIHYDVGGSSSDPTLPVKPVLPVPEPVPELVPESVPEPVPEPWFIFRCLSCFTFFIPTAHGFEPIEHPFGEGGEGENIRSPEQIPGRNVNWFFSCFESTRGKKTAEKGDGVESSIPTGPAVPFFSPAIPGRTHEWDILKSIIYGGLTETIASLGVVSSAAASDASTLNIVVLGLANLMSGLIIIIHNLQN